LRGVVGIAALWYAIRIVDPHPWWSLTFGVVALIAFRGCPICWTMGLIETLYQRVKFARQFDRRVASKPPNDSVSTK